MWGRKEVPTMSRLREAQAGRHRPRDGQKDAERPGGREGRKTKWDSTEDSYGDRVQGCGRNTGKETRSFILSANFLKHPLCARHCSRGWEYSSKQNSKNLAPEILLTYILVGKE